MRIHLKLKASAISEDFLVGAEKSNASIPGSEPVTRRSIHSMLAPRGLAPTLHLASVMLGCQDTGQPMFGNYHQECGLSTVQKSSVCPCPIK